jgi:cysteinyl-tRNA synthetase, unknown class
MRTLLAVALVSAMTAVGGGVASTWVPDPLKPLPARVGPALSDVRAWGYQLQNIDSKRVPDAVDMLVVDYSRDGSDAAAFKAADVEALRRRPGGKRRIVLCYLSIGEAENYRYYWKPSWNTRPPDWLGAENASWKGNFEVHFWKPAWQRTFFDPNPPDQSWLERVKRIFAPPLVPYLDRIIEAGFDGVYLDRVDAYEKVAEGRPQGRQEMVDFVSGLASYAKTRRPGFMVVPQNGEELLADGRYRAAIDGVAKEDLFFGVTGETIANAPDETRHTIALLNRAKADGRPVFVIEYDLDASRQRALVADLGGLGYVSVFAERGLKVPPTLPPASSASEAPSSAN